MFDEYNKEEIEEMKSSGPNAGLVNTRLDPCPDPCLDPCPDPCPDPPHEYQPYTFENDLGTQRYYHTVVYQHIETRFSQDKCCGGFGIRSTNLMASGKPAYNANRRLNNTSGPAYSKRSCPMCGGVFAIASPTCNERVLLAFDGMYNRKIGIRWSNTLNQKKADGLLKDKWDIDTVLKNYNYQGIRARRLVADTHWGLV